MPIIYMFNKQNFPAVCAFQLLAVGLCVKDWHSDNKVNNRQPQWTNIKTVIANSLSGHG